MATPWMPEYTLKERPDYLMFSYYDYPWNNPWPYNPDAMIKSPLRGEALYKTNLAHYTFRMGNALSEVQELYKANHGLSVSYGLRTVDQENTKYTFANGRPRKTPIFEYEYKETHQDSGPDAYANTLLAIKWKLEEAVRFGPERAEWLQARAAMIRPDDTHQELPITLSTSGMTRVHWPNPGSKPLSWRSVFDNEVHQFFPPDCPVSFADRYPEFKWIFRRGFCEELHCPRDYWITMQFFLQDINFQGLVEWADSQDNRKLVWYRFCTFPIQPLRKIVFTDRPDLPPVTPGLCYFRKHFHLTPRDILPYLSADIPNFSP